MTGFMEPAQNCMICDLYGAIDKHGDVSSDFVAALVTILPPRAHRFHDLAVWERVYGSPVQ